MTASRLGLADSWGSIQSIRFNQDSTAFVVSLDSGLRVFNVDPLRELSHYGADKVGSIARAEMLFRTNLLAVVSSSSHQADIMFLKHACIILRQSSTLYVVSP